MAAVMSAIRRRGSLLDALTAGSRITPGLSIMQAAGILVD